MLFDIAPSEFLVIAGAALIFIGPKDMPRALRTAGRWMGKMRRMSNHLRSGFEAMIREAELTEMEEQWRAQNAAIMAAHPAESHAAPDAAAPPPEAPLLPLPDPAPPVAPPPRPRAPRKPRQPKA